MSRERMARTVNRTPPVVTVCTCMHNAGQYLRQSIESILAQSFGNFEFIIIDDGSTDESLEIARSYVDDRIIVFPQHHSGIVRSRNRALTMARGRYVAVQDADDVSLSERLNREVQVLENHADVVLVGTGVTIIDGRGRRLRTSIPPGNHEELIPMLLRLHDPIAHSTWMIRRDVAVAAGGYDELFRRAEDYALLLRLIERGRICVIPEPHLLLRYRTDSETFGDTQGETLMYALLARALATPEVIALVGTRNSATSARFVRDFKNWYLRSSARRRFSAARLRRLAELAWREKDYARATSRGFASLGLDPSWLLDRVLKRPSGFWNMRTEREIMDQAAACAEDKGIEETRWR
jgi:glycosyltransferase involved in cell wall biosynthesis